MNILHKTLVNKQHKQQIAFSNEFVLTVQNICHSKKRNLSIQLTVIILVV